MKNSHPRLGRVQLQIMQVLWDRGEATARQITDDLSKAQPVAHSTVQTLLRTMEEKALVAHRSEERVFLFRPLVQQSEVAGDLAHDLLSRVFHGSVCGLVSTLLTDEAISPEELAGLRALIDSRAAGGEGGETL